jgi:hypothetical protein
MKEKAVKLSIVLLVLLLNMSLALALLPNFITINGSALVSLSPNLVLWLKLNEGEGNKTFDSSLYGNNGTLYNLPVWSYDHYALKFDGVNDSVNVSSGISTSDGITVELWVNASNIQPGVVSSLYQLGTQSGTVGFHWLYAQGTSLLWQYANGTNPIKKSAATFVKDQWQHIVVTHNYTSKEIKFYVNGSLKGTVTHTDDVLSVSNKSSYTGAYNGFTHWFNGTIDEVRIFSRALTEQEAKESFQRGKARCSGETGLIICMNFDEGSGNTAGDNSGNNNNGTIYGATWFFRNEAVIGNALKFDGTNDYVQVPDSSSLNITGNKLSFEAWIYPNVSKQQLILSKLTGSPYYGYEFQLSPSNQFQFYLGGTSQPLAWWGTQTIPLNTWTHVAVTYDGSQVKIYINGTFKEQFAVTGSIGSSAGEPLRLGVWRDLGYRFNGIIDEVKILNVTLTPGQIYTDYLRGVGA